MKLTELVKRILMATDDLDFPSISSGGSEELTIIVTGAAVGDAVALGLPASPPSGLVWNAYVSVVDTVTVRATNITGSAIEPAEQSYTVAVIKLPEPE